MPHAGTIVNTTGCLLCQLQGSLTALKNVGGGLIHENYDDTEEEHDLHENEQTGAATMDIRTTVVMTMADGYSDSHADGCTACK